MRRRDPQRFAAAVAAEIPPRRRRRRRRRLVFCCCGSETIGTSQESIPDSHAPSLLHAPSCAAENTEPAQQPSPCPCIWPSPGTRIKILDEGKRRKRCREITNGQAARSRLQEPQVRRLRQESFNRKLTTALEHGW